MALRNSVTRWPTMVPGLAEDQFANNCDKLETLLHLYFNLREVNWLTYVGSHQQAQPGYFRI